MTGHLLGRQGKLEGKWLTAEGAHQISSQQINGVFVCGQWNCHSDCNEKYTIIK